MRVTIRLYKTYDLDLISLYIQKGTSLPISMQNALRFYVRGVAKKIDIGRDEAPEDVSKINKSKHQLHLCFDEKKDIDVINWIKTIKSGYRNSMIKNLFRNSLLNPPLSIYGVKEFNHNANEQFKSISMPQMKKTTSKKKSIKEIGDKIINKEKSRSLQNHNSLSANGVSDTERQIFEKISTDNQSADSSADNDVTDVSSVVDLQELKNMENILDNENVSESSREDTKAAESNEEDDFDMFSMFDSLAK